MILLTPCLTLAGFLSVHSGADAAWFAGRGVSLHACAEEEGADAGEDDSGLGAGREGEREWGRVRERERESEREGERGRERERERER